MESIRRASFSLFQHVSPRTSFSLHPDDSNLILHGGGAGPQRAKSTAAIDDAMRALDWTPILGGSTYELHRAGRGKSPTHSLRHDLMTTSPTHSRHDVTTTSPAHSLRHDVTATSPGHSPHHDVIINIENADGEGRVETPASLLHASHV